MIRAFIYILISIFVITFVRMVIGIIMRGMGEALKEQSTAGRPQPGPPPRPPAATVGGELKRDPVCGTFVPATTTFRKTVNGQLQYFCSAECRDKYA
jgi:YHS domain-containing protein